MVYSLFHGNEFARVAAWIIGVVGFIGNVCILIRSIKMNLLGFGRRESKIGVTNSVRRRSPVITNYLIGNLAIADILGVFYLLIVASADAYYGYKYPQLYGKFLSANETNIWAIHPMCSIARFCFYTSPIACIMITSIIAMDRFILVIFSQSKLRFNKVKCQLLVFLAWIFSISYGLYPTIRSAIIMKMFKNRFTYAENLCLYRDNPRPVVESFIVSKQCIFYICCGLTVACYACIVVYIRSKRSGLTTKKHRMDRRVFIVMAIVTLVNVASLLPTTIAVSLRLAKAAITKTPEFSYFATGAMLFTFCNAAINPFVYMFLPSSIGNKLLLCCGVKAPRETTGSYQSEGQNI